MPATANDSLNDFERGTFTDGITHEVFRMGSGPCVVVIHELPGLTPLVADFARTLVVIVDWLRALSRHEHQRCGAFAYRFRLLTECPLPSTK